MVSVSREAGVGAEEELTVPERDWLTLVEGGSQRKVDALVAERVLGLRVEVVKPDWYDREVVLFISPKSGLVTYSPG